MSYPQLSTSIPWSLVRNGFKKTPRFNTVNQKAAAGFRSAFSLMPYPAWDFVVDLNYVLGGEAVAGSVLQKFLECYLLVCGGAGFFLFTDPNDNAVDFTTGIMLNVTGNAAAPMGRTGDGTSTKFQLARAIGAAPDIIQNANAVVAHVNGAAATGGLGSSGVFTFDTPPAVGAALAWSGGFQYLCQFTEDTLGDLGRVSKNTSGFLWSCSSIKFESVFVPSQS